MSRCFALCFLFLYLLDTNALLSTPTSDHNSSETKDLTVLQGPRGRRGKRGKRGHRTIVPSELAGLQGPSTGAETQVAVDDFVSGDTGDDAIGSLRWRHLSFFPDYVLSEHNHPGIIQIPAGGGIYLNNAATSIQGNQDFDLKMILKIVGYNPIHREVRECGLTYNSNSPQVFISIEHDETGSKIKAHSINNTIVDLGSAPALGSWFAFEIRKVGSNIDFTYVPPAGDSVTQRIKDTSYVAGKTMNLILRSTGIAWDLQVDYISLSTL